MIKFIYLSVNNQNKFTVKIIKLLKVEKLLLRSLMNMFVMEIASFFYFVTKLIIIIINGRLDSK